MLLTATLLGLIAALGILDGRLLGVSMTDRPLVMCALTGLVCGNLHRRHSDWRDAGTDLLGNVAIGAAVPRLSDVVTGSARWRPFSIMSGQYRSGADHRDSYSMLAQTSASRARG
ncbi:PTS sugar transporter subunit IIC [Salmonella enterica subsp. enterica]|nr:PTS sugar transporter subunit IIC [Salmonella enterica subsp. enterica]